MMTEPSPVVTDRPELNRYELAVDGEVAFLSYRRRDEHILLAHTEVPDAFRGRGYGGVLARHALDAARTARLQVIVKCPFVTAWLRRHHEYDDIIVARIAENGDVTRQPPAEPR
jgi:predicted GNAT family acetyltransferase